MRNNRKISYVLIITMLVSILGNGKISFAKSENDYREINKETRIITDNNENEISQITEFSTTYNLGNGLHETQIYASEVRYKDDETGKLVDYDPYLVEVKEKESSLGNDLGNYSYENESGDKKHYFPDNLSEDTPLLSEYGDYQFSMSPIMSKDNTGILEETENIENLYGDVREATNSIIYKNVNKNIDIEFNSHEDGVKESIILNKRPINCNFYYSIKTKGCHPVLSVTESDIITNSIIKEKKKYTEIIIVDDNNGDEVGVIPRPFMYDSSEDGNYSDECYYTLRRSVKGTYVLGVHVSEEYINKSSTEYPVVIDPSMTWKTSSGIDGTYVADGRQQAATFYYDSNMYVGRVNFSNAQTYIKFPSLYNFIKSNSVYRAVLTLTETEDSAAGKSLKVSDVTSSWNAKSLTYENRPGSNSKSRITLKSNGRANYTLSAGFTTYINEMRKNKADYASKGFVISTDNYDNNKATDAAVFYSPKADNPNYRPKLTVYYYDKPSKPATVSVTPYKTGIGNTLNIQYSGVKSEILDYVWYEVEKYDDKNKKPIYTASKLAYSENTKIGNSSSGSGKINIGTAYWTEGCYRVSVCGVDKNGIKGDSAYQYVHIDKTKPVINSFELCDTNINQYNYAREAPTFKWNITDAHLSGVSIKVNDEPYYNIDCSSTGKYTVPIVQLSRGNNTFKIQAIDTAGNTIESEKVSILFDNVAPKLKGGIDTLTSNLNYSNNNNIQYTLESDKSTWYILYSVNEGDYKVLNNQCSYVRNKLPQEFYEGKPGLKTIKFKAVDYAGNESNELKFNCYYDGDAPELSASLYPMSNPHSYLSIIPTINYDVEDDNYKHLEIRIKGSNKACIIKDKSGELPLPADWFDESGDYPIVLTAKDSAGNESVKTINYYFNNQNISVNNYIPNNITVNERLDGSTELVWDKVYDKELPEEISYSVYKGYSEENVSTLVCDNYRGNRYVISNQRTGLTYYYKIVAKKKMPNGAEYDSGSSIIVSSKNYTDGEKNKRMGYIPAWGYVNYELPCGTGRIERSKGNFCYSQLDMELPKDYAESMCTRTYNSMNNRVGFLGKGWTTGCERHVYITSNNNELICEYGDGSHIIY
jgi:hypothetical protein